MNNFQGQLSLSSLFSFGGGGVCVRVCVGVQQEHSTQYNVFDTIYSSKNKDHE